MKKRTGIYGAIAVCLLVFLFTSGFREQAGDDVESAKLDNCRILVNLKVADSRGFRTLKVDGYRDEAYTGGFEVGGVKGELTELFMGKICGRGAVQGFIVIKLPGEGDYKRLVAAAFYKKEGFGQLNPLENVKTGAGLKAGYRGHDRFYLEDNCLVNEFPVYLDGDMSGASGGIMKIKYRVVEKHLTSTGHKNIIYYDLAYSGFSREK